MMHPNCPRSAPLEPVLPPDPQSREWEALLIALTLGGRSDAFGDLVQPHLTRLTRYARMRLRNASEAEDAVQRSVLRAELSVVETAQRLSLTAAAVKTRHHRARKLLMRSFDRREVRPRLHFEGSFAGRASRAV